jgi:hypothetical protein
MILFLTSLLLAMSVMALPAQITVLNPSFEDQPSDATVPQGWFPCEEFTTPDILPGYWGVYNEPREGNTYVGLIVRENNTWESIGQKLSKPLGQGGCYIFSIDLAHSFIYAGYNQSIQLRIWLGDNICQKGQLIYESPVLDNEEWKKYTIEFQPESNYKYIILEAYHKSTNQQIKGNLLMDNMSSIKICGRA